MFIIQRSTATYFFGTDPWSPQKTLKPVPTLRHRLTKCFCQQTPPEKMKMRYTPACWSTWRTWGAYNMNVCTVVFESTLSPHNHVLTLDLPANQPVFAQMRIRLETERESCRHHLSQSTQCHTMSWQGHMSNSARQFHGTWHCTQCKHVGLHRDRTNLLAVVSVNPSDPV